MEASTEFVNFRLSDDNFKPHLLAPLILLQSGYHIKICHKSTWDPSYHKLMFDCIKHQKMAFSIHLLSQLFFRFRQHIPKFQALKYTWKNYSVLIG